jgi:hypothetical protein
MNGKLNGQSPTEGDTIPAAARRPYNPATLRGLKGMAFMRELARQFLMFQSEEEASQETEHGKNQEASSREGG